MKAKVARHVWNRLSPFQLWRNIAYMDFCLQRGEACRFMASVKGDLNLAYGLMGKFIYGLLFFYSGVRVEGSDR